MDWRPENNSWRKLPKKMESKYFNEDCSITFRMMNMYYVQRLSHDFLSTKNFRRTRESLHTFSDDKRASSHSFGGQERICPLFRRGREHLHTFSADKIASEHFFGGQEGIWTLFWQTREIFTLFLRRREHLHTISTDKRASSHFFRDKRDSEQFFGGQESNWIFFRRIR